VALAIGAGARTAHAADCGGQPCLRIDAVTGGGIDETATVSGVFVADILVQNANNSTEAFQFTLRYNRAVLNALPPGGIVPGFDCSTLPPSADVDGDPSTGDAFLGCFMGIGSATPGSDGVVARVAFAVVGSGSSDLRLTDVVVGGASAETLVACEYANNEPAGLCLGAAVSTSGAPPPPPPPPPPGPDGCNVVSALDGETVLCGDGTYVRFVGVSSPLGADPGADWARALTDWFLRGKTITLETDVTPTDEFGHRFGYPHVIGTDGNDYNISVLLIYVGMARHAPDGTNARYSDWLSASQTWARTACWNMWHGGNPWGAESGCP
jgi:endonuclease YncB( thermonuclease family)